MHHGRRPPGGNSSFEVHHVRAEFPGIAIMSYSVEIIGTGVGLMGLPCR
jgi:hypothetical protein